MADDSIALFVKLGYWDAYRAAVVLTARQLKKFLIIFNIMGVLMIALLLLAVLRPMPEKEWYQTLRNTIPLMWVFLLPILFVFVLPLFSARRVLSDERVQKGISYRFSETGIHLESSVAKADLQWAAFRHAIETRSAFLLLPTNNVAHTLPLRCFSSAADAKAMRELLRRSVPNPSLRG
jgi:hypothetical protein